MRRSSQHGHRQCAGVLTLLALVCGGLFLYGYRRRHRAQQKLAMPTGPQKKIPPLPSLESSQKQNATFLARNTTIQGLGSELSMRDISLYALWDNREPLHTVSNQVIGNVGVMTKTFGIWAVRHFIWRTDIVREPAPVSLDKLDGVIDAL